MRSYGPYHAVVVSIHDGDTVNLDIRLTRRRFHLDIDPLDLGFGIQLRHDGVWLANQPVRTFGDNAAELNTDAGKAALAFLQSILPIGSQVIVLSEGWDKYGGRALGSISLPDGTDLVRRMVESGHAAIWDGRGTKPVV